MDGQNREAIRSSSNLPRLRLRLRPVWVDESQFWMEVFVAKLLEHALLHRLISCFRRDRVRQAPLLTQHVQCLELKCLSSLSKSVASIVKIETTDLTISTA
jgi:hypothetical protein